MGASLLSFFLILGTLARLRHAADRPRHVLHQLRRGRGALAADRLRPQPRGGGEGPRRELVHHLPAGHPAADPARHLRRRDARLRALDRRLRDLQLQLRDDGDLPALHLRRRPARDPGRSLLRRDDPLLRHGAAMGFATWQQRRAEKMAAIRPEQEEPDIAAGSPELGAADGEGSLSQQREVVGPSIRLPADVEADQLRDLGDS